MKTIGKTEVPSNPSAAQSVAGHEPRDEGDLVWRGMQQWRAERPDLDSSGKAVVGRLIRMQEILLKAINGALEPIELKFPEYAVLATLRVSGAPYKLSPSKLQDTLLVSSGGLSNLLKRMEFDGLITRSTDKADKRGVVVKLTAKGRRLADEGMTRHAMTEQHLLRMFDAEQREMLAHLLFQMIVGNSGELSPNRHL